MPNKSELLPRRLRKFASDVSDLTVRLPHDPAGTNLARQLSRSAMSPVANYAEAREAESTADYVHKMKLCLKELRETLEWLGVAAAMRRVRMDVAALERECNELISIFVACIKKARGKK